MEEGQEKKGACLVVEEWLNKGLSSTSSSAGLAFIRPDGIKRVDSASS